MKTLILGSVAATALALSIGAASAQSQREGDSAVTLTPEQRTIVRDVVRDELQDRLGNRIADRLSHLYTGAAGSRPKRPQAKTCSRSPRGAFRPDLGQA